MKRVRFKCENKHTGIICDVNSVIETENSGASRFLQIPRVGAGIQALLCSPKYLSRVGCGIAGTPPVGTLPTMPQHQPMLFIFERFPELDSIHTELSSSHY